MALEGLSSVCAKSKPSSSKTNEILEINVLKKFTSHALYDDSVIDPIKGIFQKILLLFQIDRKSLV